MDQATLAETGISLAVKILGGPAATARLMRPALTPQAISNFVSRGYVPPERAVELERLAGIPRENLVKASLRTLIVAPRNV